MTPNDAAVTFPPYPCRIEDSRTDHLTLGTADGKRGATLCGREGLLLPTDADEADCVACRSLRSGV
jgi:hypothetical protein